MGLGHDPNPEDAAIWTAKTAIIRFNIMEMHHSDRVKMQFGMHQEIPSDPTDLSPGILKGSTPSGVLPTGKTSLRNGVRCGRGVTATSCNSLFSSTRVIYDTRINI